MTTMRELRDTIDKLGKFLEDNQSVLPNDLWQTLHNIYDSLDRVMHKLSGVVATLVGG